MGYESYKVRREINTKEEIKNEIDTFDYGKAKAQKEELTKILKNMGFKSSKSIDVTEEKKNKIKTINGKMNDAYEIMYLAENEVERLKPEEYNKLDRTVKGILAFAGEPNKLLENVNKYLKNEPGDREKLFKDAFNNALELKAKIDDAKTLDELADIYKNNPFGFNALAEFDKGTALIDYFNIQDQKFFEDVMEHGKSMNESALKEKALEVAQDPYSFYLNNEDSMSIDEAMQEGDSDVLVTFVGDVKNTGIKVFQSVLVGAKTINKDGMEIQANGTLGQRDKNGRFQGFYNEAYNIDKGFKSTETDNISKDDLKNKLDDLYNNLKKNNTITMRWRSKSNYADIMKKLDNVRKLDSREDMLKGLDEIVSESDTYLNTKGKEKKSTTNSVLRENAIFKLHEFCKSAMEKNQPVAQKEEKVDIGSKENMLLPDYEFEEKQVETEIEKEKEKSEQKTMYGVSFKDVLKKGKNLKHIGNINENKADAMQENAADAIQENAADALNL